MMITKCFKWCYYFWFFGRDVTRVYHSRNQKIFHQSLCRKLKGLCTKRIARVSLHHPVSSSWWQLYLSNNDQALVTLTGFDHFLFDFPLNLFDPVYHLYSSGDDDGNGLICQICNYNYRRPWLVSAADCLGLNLAWTCFRGSSMPLQLVFGMTGSRVSKWLHFGSWILIMILLNYVDAAVWLPSAEKLEIYEAAIQVRHPSLTNVLCTMDGLMLYLQQSCDWVIQNMFYNGWTHDHYVLSVFVFCPDGTIPIAAINYPGCFHESQIAEWGKGYKKFEIIFGETGGKCVVDSAFAKLVQLLDQIISDSPGWCMGGHLE